MTSTPEDLVGALRAAQETDYVRLVADWLTRGDINGPEPSVTGDPTVDALIGASVAYRARQLGCSVPAWTRAPERISEYFWHPGSDRFFALALAHSPAEFAIRGLFIDADSLRSV
jgi:hypothetical protein